MRHTDRSHKLQCQRLALGALIFLAGCTTRSAPPVEGTVTLDDKPLAGVQVLFDQPEVDNGNSFAGKTDEEGRFELRLLSEEVSLPASGTYRVSLTTAVADRDATESTPLPKEKIPKKYRDGALTFELPEDGTLDADFALKSR